MAPAVLRRLVWLIPALAVACHDAAPPATSACDGHAIRMGVASSLREVALGLQEDLRAKAPPIETEAVFGASSVLARQIELGAPMDLLVSADPEIVARLGDEGRIDPASVREIARGELVLMARDGWAEMETARAALESDRLRRIAVPAAAVPLGRYARAWLDGQDLLDGLRSRIVITEHARATLAAVDGGSVDLALVYASDAQRAAHARAVARIDSAEHPPIRYVEARVATSADCDAVDDVARAWTEPAARARLAAQGFRQAEEDAGP